MFVLKDTIMQLLHSSFEMCFFHCLSHLCCFIYQEKRTLVSFLQIHIYDHGKMYNSSYSRNVVNLLEI